jgi:hypothetical protein
VRWTAVASEMRPYQSDLGEKCSPQRCAQRLFKSKPRASAREDLKRNWRSVGSRGKKCVVRRSIGSKGRKKHWCGERELSSPIKSMVLPGKR